MRPSWQELHGRVPYIPLAVKFYFQFKSRHVSSYATFMCVIIQSFSQMTDDTYAPMTMTMETLKMAEPRFRSPISWQIQFLNREIWFAIRVS